MTKRSTTTKIVHPIYQLRRCNEKQLRINTRFAERRSNGVDCGIFPIAFHKSRENALGTKFNEKSPVWIFDERGVFLAQLQHKENKGNKRITWAARYIMYLLRAILWGSYGRRQRELYDSLIKVRRVVSQKM